MVYLKPRTPNSTSPACQSASYVPPLGDNAYRCQNKIEDPYCWPLNGTRICPGQPSTINFFWPSKFYHEDARILIDFGDRISETSPSNGGILANKSSTELKDYERYADEVFDTSRIHDKVLRITIREWWPNDNDAGAIGTAVHEGPTLILAAPRASLTAGPYSSAIPDSHSASFDEGKIIGAVLGSVIGVVALVVMIIFCCRGCCCFQQEAEEKRVRRLEARRLQREAATAETQIDATKDIMPRGVVNTGPVRPGGMWAVDLPKSASRPSSSASDEIRAVDVVEEQRLQELKGEEREEEEKDVQPPAYDERPPKYAP